MVSKGYSPYAPQTFCFRSNPSYRGSCTPCEIVDNDPLLRRSRLRRSLGISLLLQVELDTALASLAVVVLQMSLLLRFRVARQACDSAAYGAMDTIADALTEIADLALGLLRLAVLVLLDALLLERFRADEAAEHLLAAADGLVPVALRAVGVVLRDAAAAADGEWAGAGCGMAEVLLCGGLVLLVLTSSLRNYVRGYSAKGVGKRAYLVSGAAGQRAEGRLCRAGDRIDGRLEGGSGVSALVGRHVGGCDVYGRDLFLVGSEFEDCVVKWFVVYKQ